MLERAGKDLEEAREPGGFRGQSGQDRVPETAQGPSRVRTEQPGSGSPTVESFRSTVPAIGDSEKYKQGSHQGRLQLIRSDRRIVGGGWKQVPPAVRGCPGGRHEAHPGCQKEDLHGQGNVEGRAEGVRTSGKQRPVQRA
jgi:hypothetical protein